MEVQCLGTRSNCPPNYVGSIHGVCSLWMEYKDKFKFEFLCGPVPPDACLPSTCSRLIVVRYGGVVMLLLA